MTDSDVKMIRYGRKAVPDDPSMPYLVEVSLSPPGFMQVAFVLLCGPSEELVVRCATRDAVDRFLDASKLRDHVRLQRVRVTGPDGVAEEITPATRRSA